MTRSIADCALRIADCPRLLIVLSCLALPSTLSAQNSAYGVLGIGFPSAPFGVVARSMGGGLSGVDAQSFLNPGALGLVRALSVQGASMQEFRNFSVAGVSTAGLKQSRFPFIGVTSPVGPHLAYSFSFSQYAERTYDVRTTDTVMLRGAPVGVTDRAASSGGVADVQFGLAWARDPKLSFGVAGHLLTGSAKVSTTREFTDPFYRSFTDNVDATFGGFGLSAGLVASPSTALRLGASVRTDTRLERRVAGQNLGHVKLPVTASAGVEIRFSPALRLASTGIWRSWSGATADLASAGTRAFDTFDWGLGVDLGGTRGGPPLPLRLGLRYATLPFSPNAEQPKELALSAGTTVSLARGRAHFDVAAERVMRDGGGLEEKAWQITLGFTVRP